MSAEPSWLPELVTLNEHGGQWDAYIEAVYEAFRQDFIQAAPTFRSMPVYIKRYPIEDGKERGFWHVTSAGREESTRTPDMRRCERIRWVRAIIGHCNDDSVKVWENTRKDRTRTVLWLERCDFLVVLEKRRKNWLLWTAYPVTEEHRKRKLQSEYEASEKS